MDLVSRVLWLDFWKSDAESNFDENLAEWLLVLEGGLQECWWGM